ncbi:oxidoreductase family protein [Colletotrichum limetticola]|uniref:Oxidoreductase family protein n=1 Tax=Colletotrichum limetticola TaxID=1209924 RepID=A0ABQ9QB52_9PEZI|nr:oxidoreductase family protein [Colletotrichum limetticola]
MAPIRVGIIGLSAKEAVTGPGAWASIAILPSFKNSLHYEIVALCNSSAEAARRSIEMHKLPSTTKAYGDVEQLASDPDVDLVVVSVVVTKHLAVTLPALANRKQVFVEWPLGASAQEAEQLTQLANSGGLKTIVGLQGRSDALTLKLREIIQSGEIGEIKHTSVAGTLPYFPPNFWVEGAEYYLDIKTGGNAFHIGFGHFLDSFTNVVGDFDLSSLSSVLKSDVDSVPLYKADRSSVIDPAYPKSSPDHILVQGVLQNGAVASIACRTTPVTVGEVGARWIISGTKGEIEAVWDGGQWQIHSPSKQLKYKLVGGEEQKVILETGKLPDGVEVSAAGLNTLLIFDAYAKGDTSRYADFETALKNHVLLETILKKSGYKPAAGGSQQKFGTDADAGVDARNVDPVTNLLRRSDSAQLPRLHDFTHSAQQITVGVFSYLRFRLKTSITQNERRRLARSAQHPQQHVVHRLTPETGSGGAIASAPGGATPPKADKPKHIAILDTDVMVTAVQTLYGQYYSAQYIKRLTAAATRIGASHLATFTTWDVVAGHYPNPADVDAILITGSIAAAYDTDPWVLRLGDFIRRVYEHHPNVRIFGTCFGHQLIGKVLLEPHGAVVEKDPNGYEFGVQTISLNPKLVEDFPCLAALAPATRTTESEQDSGSSSSPPPHGLRLQMCHGDHVALAPPPNPPLPGTWQNIGGSAHCRVQGLYEPSRVLTIQPHFECDQVIMEETIKHFYTPAKGFSPEFLQRAFDATRREDDAGVAAEWVFRFLVGI